MNFSKFLAILGCDFFVAILGCDAHLEWIFAEIYCR